MGLSKFFYLMTMILVFSGCGSTTDRNLGEGFYLYQESRNNQIILFCTTEGLFQCNSGDEVVSSNVSTVSSNQEFIIAKSSNSGKDFFWIIIKDDFKDERENAILKFSNNQEFQLKKAQLGINMELSI